MIRQLSLPSGVRNAAVLLLTFLTVPLVIAACGPDVQQRSVEPEASTSITIVQGSAWDRAVDDIGDDGEVPLPAALAAFSIAIAPLPGVAVPDHPVEDIPSGTGAVRWVVGHWDDLTAAQRSAVVDALEPGSTPGPAAIDGGGRGRSRAAGNAPCFGPGPATADSPGAGRYRAVADRIVPRIESALGGAVELRVPTHIVLEQRETVVARAYTWAYPADCQSNDVVNCTIHLNPVAQSASDPELEAILAHELTHCFIFQSAGIAAYDLPPWVGEGFPAWAGEELAGGTKIAAKWWKKYLTRPAAPLFGREYDAIGFYAHLDETGTDPWSRMVSMINAGDSASAFRAAGADQAAFLDTWPSSFARTPERGTAWDTTMPGITADKADITKRSVGNGGQAKVAAPTSANGLLAVKVTADIVEISTEGHGRFHDGSTDTVLTSVQTFCARDGGCECPEGSGGGFSGPSIGRDLVIAVTGGAAPASATVVGRELECDEQPEPPATSIDECLVGDWISTQIVLVDTVTGAPAEELGGGANSVLSIAADGSFTVDHSSSTPIVTDLDGLELSSTLRGIGHGTISAEGGQITLLTNDFAQTTQTLIMGGRGIAGAPSIGTGSYTCNDGALAVVSPFELGEEQSYWGRG